MSFTNFDKRSRLDRCHQWSTDAVVTNVRPGPRRNMSFVKNQGWWNMFYIAPLHLHLIKHLRQDVWKLVAKHTNLIFIDRPWFSDDHYERCNYHNYICLYKSDILLLFSRKVVFPLIYLIFFWTTFSKVTCCWYNTYVMYKISFKCANSYKHI